ncbi:MAG: DUF4199 domain-containing protein [Bacteroidales bacterium]|nr:DUF4199 domain-containing protein [Bacteroidales bacterium]
MEKKSSFRKAILTNGLMLGLALIIYSVLLYIFDLNLNKSLGYVSYIIILAGLIFWTKSYRDNNMNGFITYGQALGFGTMIVIVAAVLSAIYTYLFVTVIDPDIIDKILAISEEEMLKKGMSDDQVEMAQSFSKKFMSPVVMSISGFIGTSILGFILSLITSAFLKKEGDPYQEAMQDIEE